MAYVLPQEEDEEELKQEQASQMAPKLGGSQTLGVGGGGLSSAPTETPRSQNVTQKGTGFTNLQSWLDAGKGRDKAISSTGSSLLGQEKDAFGAAKKPMEEATGNFKVKTVEDVNKPGMGEDLFGNKLNAAARGEAGAKDEIKGMLDQDYKGPLSVDYNARDKKSLWDVGALSDASTASNVLARPAMQSGQYGAGLQRLDSVLFGADAASRAALDANKQGLTDFSKQVGAESEALATRASGLKADAAKARAGVKTELERQGDKWLADLDTTVNQKRDEEKMVRDALDQGIVYDPKTGTRTRLGDSLSRGDTVGGGATRENVMTAEQKSGFDLLSELIGAPKMQKTGTYQDVETQIIKDPNWKAPSQYADWTHDDIRNSAMALPNEQRTAWINEMSTFAKETGSDPRTWGANEMTEYFKWFQQRHPEVKWTKMSNADASRRLNKNHEPTKQKWKEGVKKDLLQTANRLDAFNTVPDDEWLGFS
jgi:hypothetical protein